jgi:hypothetical protein
MIATSVARARRSFSRSPNDAPCIDGEPADQDKSDVSRYEAPQQLVECRGHSRASGHADEGQQGMAQLDAFGEVDTHRSLGVGAQTICTDDVRSGGGGHVFFQHHVKCYASAQFWS